MAISKTYVDALANNIAIRSGAFTTVVVLLPSGMTMEDLEGLLAGYAKATGTPQADILLATPEPVAAGGTITFSLSKA